MKTSGHQSEETILMKAFKYFDLDNSGQCSRNEWLKALTKIGISGFTDKNLLDIFELYDTNRNNELSYKEFIGSLFSNQSLKKQTEIINDPKKTQEAKADPRKIDGINEILQRIRERLAARGIRGMMSMQRAFKVFTYN